MNRRLFWEFVIMFVIVPVLFMVGLWIMVSISKGRL